MLDPDSEEEMNGTEREPINIEWRMCGNSAGAHLRRASGDRPVALGVALTRVSIEFLWSARNLKNPLLGLSVERKVLGPLLQLFSFSTLSNGAVRSCRCASKEKQKQPFRVEMEHSAAIGETIT